MEYNVRSGRGGGFGEYQPDSAQERVQRSMDVPAVTAAPPRLSPGIRYCPEMIERRCIDKSAPRQGFFPTCSFPRDPKIWRSPSDPDSRQP